MSLSFRSFQRVNVIYQILMLNIFFDMEVVTMDLIKDISWT